MAKARESARRTERTWMTMLLSWYWSAKRWLIMVLVFSGVNQHTVHVSVEAERVEETHIFIRHQGSGHGKVLRGDFQEVYVVEVLIRK